ncbi:MAG: FAD:protein FMN transferase [Flavobacteriaceae bacterium]
MLSTMEVYKKFISGGLFALLVGCQPTQPASVQRHSGSALGTSYAILYQGTAQNFARNQSAFDSIFQVLNQSMSTYWPHSLISEINRGNDSIQVDQHFSTVFQKTTEIWQATSGLFDPTVGGLINAYGFGPTKGLKVLKTKQIDSLLILTGWGKIQLSDKRTVIKKDPRIQIDFNAIAKGYTVDVIGDYLVQNGYTDFLVEIGGEIVAKGNSPKTQRPWTVAIDDPQQENERRFTTTLSLTNAALATSGNYRKFRMDSVTGERYVHTLHPKTGRPVKSNVLSASVRAADCMTADAWATALMVLPLEEGQRLIAQIPTIEAYWIVAQGDKTQEIPSANW